MHSACNNPLCVYGSSMTSHKSKICCYFQKYAIVADNRFVDSDLLAVGVIAHHVPSDADIKQLRT